MVRADGVEGVSFTGWPEGDCQVAIAGGGLVGTSLALALAAAGTRVALIEARDDATPDDSGFGARPIALSQGSRRILAALGVWDDLDASATPITRVHVSDRGRFASTASGSHSRSAAGSDSRASPLRNAASTHSAT